METLLGLFSVGETQECVCGLSRNSARSSLELCCFQHVSPQLFDVFPSNLGVRAGRSWVRWKEKWDGTIFLKP